jgi:hypothetical protein
MKVKIPTLDVFKTIKQLDDYVFDQVENNGAGTQWCSIYVDEMFTGTNAFGSRTKYSSVLLLNATAQAVVGAFGPQVYTAYLKDYLIRNTLIPADAALNVTFVDNGLPISKQFEAI